MRAREHVWVALFCILGCANDVPFTQVFVELSSEPASFASGADEFRVTLWDEEFETLLETVVLPEGTDWSIPLTIPIAAGDNDGSKRFAVRAELLDGGRSLGVQRAIGGFDQDAHRTVRLVFRPECEVDGCGDEQTCTTGASCGPACFDFDADGRAVFVACEDICEDCIETCDPAREVCATGLTLGDEHSCAMQGAQLECWGGNGAGQLGPAGTGRPASVNAPSGDWQLVRAGGLATCGVSGTQIFCVGEHPDGTVTSEFQAVDAFGTGPWSDFDVSSEFGCAARDGTLTCLGTRSELRRGTFEGDWQQVRVAGPNACALDSTSRFDCWGRDEEGQNGDGPGGGNDGTPDPPVSPLRFAELEPGGGHACARTPGGDLYCWGEGDAGSLGLGDRPLERCGSSHDCQTEPTQLMDGLWTAVCSGFRFSCGIRDETLFCWGLNDSGQLGVGESGGMRNSPTPAIVDPSLRWSSLACGQAHACAISLEGGVYCWGNDTNGQVGVLGDSVFVNVPTQVER